jgi:hypothetical protein
MKEVKKEYVSFGYLWRIGVLDYSRLNSEVYKDEVDGLWKCKYNPLIDECYANHSNDEIEVCIIDEGSRGITNKGKQSAIAIFNKYNLKYNVKYLEGESHV